MPTSDIKPALKRLSNNIHRYQEYYEYYAGKHQLNFASEKFKNKFGKRLQKLRENLCKTVVKAPASRLEPIGFLSEQKDVQDKAWKFWKKNKLPRHSGKVHREAFKTGDAYVLVWGDPVTGKPVITPQLAVNITVWKNADTGEIEKAAKAWRGEDGFWYLTLYYADVIEKYVGKGKSEAFPLEPNHFDQRHIAGEPFPLPNPYGKVPIFHFTYDEELMDFGNSILADVIPLNDALNKSYSDILGAQEENMRRRRYVAGLQTETDDETGKPINPYKPDDDLWMANEEATFGEFSDADLAQMLLVKAEAVRDIALVSGIPPSYFNLESVGQAISGEALRKIEARFTAIVQDAQRSFGESWAEVVSFALQIEEAMLKGIEIETQWTDAAPVSETEILDNSLKKKNLGWSIEQIQRDYGLTEEQIKQMAGENSKRAEAEMQAQAKFFDAGNTFE